MGQPALQILQCSSVGGVNVVDGRVGCEIEPLLQACYSLLHNSAGQLSDLVAGSCLQVSAE